MTARAGLGGERLGTGRVRRRLRQRRPRRSLRHVLGAEPALSQHRRRHVRRRDARRGIDRAAALGHRVRVSRLRPRRAARSVRRQLHRSRSRDDAAALVRPVPIQGTRRRVRPSGPARGQERVCIATAATARSPMCRRRPASRARRAPTGSAWRRSTSTPTAGSMSTSRTTRTRARSIATTATARSPTSAPPRGAPTARTARRRPAWGSPSATTIATARWTCSRRTSPATRPRCTRTPATACAKIERSPSGIGVNTRWLGWGVGFLDLDADGWLDLFLVNGHVYPEVAALETEAGYEQPKVVYRNLGNGRFADVTAQLGPPVTTPKAGRGAVFADFDNDGDVDVLVNNMHDTPDLFRLDRSGERHWISLKLVGTRSNRSAIGALVRVVTADGEQRQEVRGGGSYYSQNDLRLHFGLGQAARRRPRSSCAGRTASKRRGPDWRSTACTR